MQRELDAIIDAAWDGYINPRKSPVTCKAGSGFADPDYDLSVDWLAAREAILSAQRRHDAAGETPRILLVNGSSRSELKGWPYPRHLAGRHFGIVTHGDSVGAETLRRSPVDWLTDRSLISAGGMAEADGYIGYMEPYATSHQVLDEDTAFQEDVRNVARALGNAVKLHGAGKYQDPGEGLVDPNPK